MSAARPAYDTYAGTEDGVLLLSGDARSLGLRGSRISAVHALRAPDGDVIVVAGTYGDGLRRSADGGASWQPVQGVSAPAARWIGPDPMTPGALLCGTEPARLFRSLDLGLTWTDLPGIEALPEHETWFLPYSPRAGALRNVHALPGRPGHLVAAVEVGGMLRTTDGGRSWSIEEIAGNDDIHQVTGDPEDGDRLWASLGYAALPVRRRHPGDRHLGGVARSRDGGRTWVVLHTDYTRSTVLVPGSPGLVLSGPAPKVGEGGRIVVSTDDGESWRPAGGGLETPMPDMVELFVPAPDGTIFAICSGGRLLRADPADWRWTPVGRDGAGGKAVSVSFLPR
ncbi:MAG: WD40/YVTN/BNR-like repeat-containing protein [Candidatus Dormibacteraceae bacterium]